MPATLFPDRASRERSVSVLSDRSYQSATESKLDAYARYYGISLASRNSMESDYSNEYTSSKRMTRISEIDDRRTTDREYSVVSGTSGIADYSTALVAANAIDARARSKTPFLDLSREVRERPAAYDYSSTGKSDTEALHDVLSYTRNVLSLMGTDGNVKVNLNYRPIPPVYNYNPTHKHYHTYSPNNYYVTQPAPAPQPAFQPPAPVYHHHYHYPTRTSTTTTTRRYYLPYSTAAQQWNVVKSSGEITTESSAAASRLDLDYRRSNRAMSEFRESSNAAEAIDYRGRSGRAMSEFRETDAGAGYGDYGYGGYSGDYRAKSQSRARSELADIPLTEYEILYDKTNRRAKLDAALEEDEDNYRRRAEVRGASLRP